MNINSKVKIHNRFDVHIDNIETGEHLELVGFNNVLDQMWTRLCGGSSYFANIHFGTGTGTLDPTRNALFSHLGTKPAQDEELIKAIPLSTWKRKIVLAPEEYVDQTITEVGIAYGSTASYLVTHAMLKDAEGNQISITKKATDVITIYATVFVTFDTSIPELTWLGMPSSNKLVNYLIGGSASPTGYISLLDGPGYGKSLGNTATVIWTSDVVNKKRKTNIPRFGIDVGNGDVLGVGMPDVFSLELPATGIFEGETYTNVPIGVGDGLSIEFELPSKHVKHASVTVKADGVPQAVQLEDFNNGINFYQTSLPLVPTTSNYQNLGFIGGSKSGEYAIACHTTQYQTVKPIVVAKKNDKGIYEIIGEVPSSPLNYNSSFRKFESDDAGTTMVVTASNGFIVIFIDPLDDSITAINIADAITTSGMSNDGTVLVTGSAATKVYDIDKVNKTVTLRPAHDYGIILRWGAPIVMSETGDLFIAVDSSNKIAGKLYNGSVWEDLVVDVNTVNPYQMVANADQTEIVAISSAEICVYSRVGKTLTLDYTLPFPYGLLHAVAEPDFNTIWISTTTSPNYSVFKLIKVSGIWELSDITISVNKNLYIFAASNDNLFTATSEAYQPIPYKIYDINPRNLKAIFDTPPAVGVALTADYTVKGIHKTVNQIVDCSFSIQFGEGV